MSFFHSLIVDAMVIKSYKERNVLIGIRKGVRVHDEI
jgi:hypothetical protein